MDVYTAVDLSGGAGESIIVSGYFNQDGEFILHKMNNVKAKTEADESAFINMHIAINLFDFPEAPIHIFVSDGLGFESEHVKEYTKQYENNITIHKVKSTEYSFRMYVEEGHDPEDRVEYACRFLEYFAIKYVSI